MFATSDHNSFQPQLSCGTVISNAAVEAWLENAAVEHWRIPAPNKVLQPLDALQAVEQPCASSSSWGRQQPAAKQLPQRHARGNAFGQRLAGEQPVIGELFGQRPDVGTQIAGTSSHQLTLLQPEEECFGQLSSQHGHERSKQRSSRSKKRVNGLVEQHRSDVLHNSFMSPPHSDGSLFGKRLSLDMPIPSGGDRFSREPRGCDLLEQSTGDGLRGQTQGWWPLCNGPSGLNLGREAFQSSGGQELLLPRADESTVGTPSSDQPNLLLPRSQSAVIREASGCNFGHDRSDGVFAKHWSHPSHSFQQCSTGHFHDGASSLFVPAHRDVASFGKQSAFAMEPPTAHLLSNQPLVRPESATMHQPTRGKLGHATGSCMARIHGSDPGHAFQHFPTKGTRVHEVLNDMCLPPHADGALFGKQLALDRELPIAHHLCMYSQPRPESATSLRPIGGKFGQPTNNGIDRRRSDPGRAWQNCSATHVSINMSSPPHVDGALFGKQLALDVELPTAHHLSGHNRPFVRPQSAVIIPKPAVIIPNLKLGMLPGSNGMAGTRC